MGHGTDTSREGMIYVKLKNTAKGETPIFVYKEKGEETEGDYLSGYITDMGISSYPWEGDTIPTLVINMIDNGQKYQFEASYTSMSRAMLNCLMTVESPGLIKFKVVPGKEKDDYPTVFVTVDEADALSWKWKYVDFAKLIDGEGKTKDYSRLNDMWASEIENTLAPRFKEAFARMSHQGNFQESAEPLATSKTKIPEVDKPSDGSIKAKDINIKDQLPKEYQGEDPGPSLDDMKEEAKNTPE